MKLRSFQITAYRSCLDTSFFPHPELTALIGINGVGKSNLLNGILLLRKVIMRNRPSGFPRKKPGNRCGVSFELIHDGKIIKAKGIIYYDTDEKNQDEVLFSELKWNFKDHLRNRRWFELPLNLAMRHRDFRMVIETTGIRYYLANDLPKKLVPVISELFEYLAGINYYSATQFSDPSNCPISIELDENSPIRKSGLQFGHEKFILDLYRISISDKRQFKKYLNTVCNMGLNLIEDITFKAIELPSSTYEIKTGGKIRQIEKTRSIIVPCFVIDKNSLSPNQLSEGTLKTLAIIFYVLTDESKLLLIEEPEACVHHGLLNSIMSIIKLQAKRKQIIISTHSDYVLDLLVPENVILIHKGAGTGTIASPLNDFMSANDFSALRGYLLDTGTLGEYWKETGFE